MDACLFRLGRSNDQVRVRKNGTRASSSSVTTQKEMSVPAPSINIYRHRFHFHPQLCTFVLLFLHRSLTLSLPTLSLVKRMASNDNNGKCKLEEEAETSAARKRLWLSDYDGGDDVSSDSQHEDTNEEVSLEESSMNQVNTSEDK
jgi:hypothetical protein